MAAYSCSSKLVVIVVVMMVISCVVSAQKSSDVPLTKGLSWSFYDKSCPKVESIIRTQLKKVFKQDIGQAAGLLRLHFHDCFVQGCDASVLLDGSASGPSEKNAPPNLQLRQKSFEIINDLQDRIQKKCGRVVSCSDIAAIAARDSVFLSGGPDYAVPQGRRDGLTFATQQVTIANLPSSSSNATTILNSLAQKNLDPTDTVALSGGHTIGLSHCSSFRNRLYPTQDPVMDKTFAKNLKEICPNNTTIDATTVLDIRSPNAFDNKYYVNLMNRQGLFTSDQDLYSNSKTKDIVINFAVNQSLFFEKFIVAMTKMGQLSVLTGNQGEIRSNCSARNSDNKDYLVSLAHEDVDNLSAF